MSWPACRHEPDWNTLVALRDCVASLQSHPANYQDSIYLGTTTPSPHTALPYPPAPYAHDGKPQPELVMRASGGASATSFSSCVSSSEENALSSVRAPSFRGRPAQHVPVDARLNAEPSASGAHPPPPPYRRAPNGYRDSDLGAMGDTSSASRRGPTHRNGDDQLNVDVCGGRAVVHPTRSYESNENSKEAPTGPSSSGTSSSSARARPSWLTFDTRDPAGNVPFMVSQGTAYPPAPAVEALRRVPPTHDQAAPSPRDSFGDKARSSPPRPARAARMARDGDVTAPVSHQPSGMSSASGTHPPRPTEKDEEGSGDEEEVWEGSREHEDHPGDEGDDEAQDRLEEAPSGSAVGADRVPSVRNALSGVSTHYPHRPAAAPTAEPAVASMRRELSEVSVASSAFTQTVGATATSSTTSSSFRFSHRRPQRTSNRPDNQLQYTTDADSGRRLHLNEARAQTGPEPTMRGRLRASTPSAGGTTDPWVMAAARHSSSPSASAPHRSVASMSREPRATSSASSLSYWSASTPVSSLAEDREPGRKSDAPRAHPHHQRGKEKYDGPRRSGANEDVPVSVSPFSSVPRAASDLADQQDRDAAKESAALSALWEAIHALQAAPANKAGTPSRRYEAPTNLVRETEPEPAPTVPPLRALDADTRDRCSDLPSAQALSDEEEVHGAHRPAKSDDSGEDNGDQTRDDALVQSHTPRDDQPRPPHFEYGCYISPPFRAQQGRGPVVVYDEDDAAPDSVSSLRRERREAEGREASEGRNEYQRDGRSAKDAAHGLRAFAEPDMSCEARDAPQPASSMSLSAATSVPATHQAGWEGPCPPTAQRKAALQATLPEEMEEETHDIDEQPEGVRGEPLTTLQNQRDGGDRHHAEVIGRAEKPIAPSTPVSTSCVSSVALYSSVSSHVPLAAAKNELAAYAPAAAAPMSAAPRTSTAVVPRSPDSPGKHHVTRKPTIAVVSHSYRPQQLPPPSSPDTPVPARARPLGHEHPSLSARQVVPIAPSSENQTPQASAHTKRADEAHALIPDIPSATGSSTSSASWHALHAHSEHLPMPNAGQTKPPPVRSHSDAGGQCAGTKAPAPHSTNTSTVRTDELSYLPSSSSSSGVPTPQLSSALTSAAPCLPPQLSRATTAQAGLVSYAPRQPSPHTEPSEPSATRGSMHLDTAPPVLIREDPRRSGGERNKVEDTHHRSPGSSVRRPVEVPAVVGRSCVSPERESEAARPRSTAPNGAPSVDQNDSAVDDRVSAAPSLPPVEATASAVDDCSGGCSGGESRAADDASLSSATQRTPLARCAHHTTPSMPSTEERAMEDVAGTVERETKYARVAETAGTVMAGMMSVSRVTTEVSAVSDGAARSEISAGTADATHRDDAQHVADETDRVSAAPTCASSVAELPRSTVPVAEGHPRQPSESSSTPVDVAPSPVKPSRFGTPSPIHVQKTCRHHHHHSRSSSPNSSTTNTSTLPSRRTVNTVYDPVVEDEDEQAVRLPWRGYTLPASTTATEATHSVTPASHPTESTELVGQPTLKRYLQYLNPDGSSAALCAAAKGETAPARTTTAHVPTSHERALPTPSSRASDGGSRLASVDVLVRGVHRDYRAMSDGTATTLLDRDTVYEGEDDESGYCGGGAYDDVDL